MPRKKQRKAGSIELPKGVHRVVSRGREYFYWHPGRGTKSAPKPIPLPSDPHSPEFWTKVREHQGVGVTTEESVNAVIDAFEASPAFTHKISEGTRDQYQRALRIAREAWGPLPIAGIRPVHVVEMMEALVDTPGKANNFLAAMRALSIWAIKKDKITAALTTGAEPYVTGGGHKPWTAEQIAAAHKHLTGSVRMGVMLMLYTGQRGSDMVRMGWAMVDDNGFSLTQKKTDVAVWCPILPELAAEMATWTKGLGPFVKQEGRSAGKPYTRNQFHRIWFEMIKGIPELADATLHGLRATAVVRLRRAGLNELEISNIVGMSAAMITRYCRFDDKKATGKAAVIKLNEARKRT